MRVVRTHLIEASRTGSARPRNDRRRRREGVVVGVSNECTILVENFRTSAIPSTLVAHHLFDFHGVQNKRGFFIEQPADRPTE